MPNSRKYLIVPTAALPAMNEAEFTDTFNTTRVSNDGTMAVLEYISENLPEGVTFLTHGEAVSEMMKPNWAPDETGRS